MPERLVVVGGDAAGMAAASAARRRTDRADLEVVAFERGDYTSYSACGLPYYVAGDISDVDELIARSPQEHRTNGIDVRTRHEVVEIDVAGRTVTVDPLDGTDSYSLPFDRLVIATGATPIRPDLPGVEARGIHGIQTIYDGIALHEHVNEHGGDGHRAVVVGGGYVGLEMAEALQRRGLPVTMIEAGPQPVAPLDPDMGAIVADALRGLGVDLRTETPCEGFDVDGDGHVTGVRIPGETLPADIVVLGIGVKPNSALAAEAGLAVGERGGITTDDHMATSVDGIWAAGDCIETFHLVSRRRVTIPLGTHANKQGRVAGINATAGDASFKGVVGTAVAKVCEYEIGRTGLNEKEATAAGFEFDTTRIESTTRAGYFPGAQPITVKIVVETRTGRIIGAQIIGREGAAKRIDVLAAAIWNEMTIDEFWQLDLGYAPPFAPVWDPTIVAARVALGKRG
jgi:NADPH-dependent 2,4-dienoyl-CoA reductase/sulfur reductase-like enzyme